MSEFKYHLEIPEGRLVLGIDPPQTRGVLLKEEGLKDILPTGSCISSLQIPHVKAASVVRFLGLSRRLYVGGKKVFFDPFSILSCHYEISDEGNAYRIKGVWKLKSLEGPFSDFSLLYPSHPSFGIRQGTLQFFEEQVTPEPLLLSQEELELFLKEEEHLVWRCEPPLKKLSCTPRLLLSDRTGAFANLAFDYGKERIFFHDVKKNPVRDLILEKAWEQDLLETGFIYKMQEKSHYYCPLEQVAKSLTFLLELGWKIEDVLGKEVIRQGQEEIDIKSHAKGILIQGKMTYADHTVDLQKVLGAFNRKERFVVLDAGHVGLIDPLSWEGEYEELSSGEILSEGIFLKKNQIGQIASFENKPHIRIEKKLQEPPVFLPPDESFQGKLLPYQQEGLNFLLFLKGWGCGGLLADEMGLGKTVQVLAFFSHHKGPKPFLVVVPTSLLFNWKKEIERFLPTFPFLLYSGPNRSLESACHVQLILTSYTLVRQDFEKFQAIEYEGIILDEGQTIKNPESQIAKALFHLPSSFRLVMTGTPIENRWEDLWSLFHFLMPDLLGERREFNAKMTAAAVDHRYLLQTKKKIRPFLIRRLKKQVAQDLPEKFSQTVFVEMGEAQRRLYEKWVQSNRQGLMKKIATSGASSHRMEILEAILRLRQLASHPWLVERDIEGDLWSVSGKMERLFCDLEEVIGENHKVLIYSQFTQMLRFIELGIKEKGYRYVYLDGSTKNREEVVSSFQDDPTVSIFLISLKAGGVGLNLTAADYVFLFDPWWNEAAENQAIDRAHRMGRKGAVIARRYITAESIEEKLLHLKQHKTGLSDNLFNAEGEGFSELSIEDLQTLLT